MQGNLWIYITNQDELEFECHPSNGYPIITGTSQRIGEVQKSRAGSWGQQKEPLILQDHLATVTCLLQHYSIIFKSPSIIQLYLLGRASIIWFHKSHLAPLSWGAYTFVNLTSLPWRMNQCTRLWSTMLYWETKLVHCRAKSVATPPHPTLESSWEWL